MAETPMDIILKHLSAEAESVALGNSPADTHGIAIGIMEELKKNFRITSYAGATPPGHAEATKDDWKLVEENRTTPVTPVVTPGRADDHVEIKIRVTGNPMLWYMGTDLQPYRLDTLIPGDRVPLRERQIAKALIDLSADGLRDQTL